MLVCIGLIVLGVFGICVLVIICGYFIVPFVVKKNKLKTVRFREVYSDKSE